MISDREPQFVVGLTKELNKILGIETKLSTAYHLQIDKENKSRARTVLKDVHQS